MYEWFIFSIILLGIWFIFYTINSKLRREMLMISTFTAPIGLTQPLFLGRYWSPPSLFNLNVITGFDIESVIFSFAIGGIVAILYELIFKSEHVKIDRKAYDRGRLFHTIAIISPIIVFVPLYLFTELNPIYSTVIALFTGGILTIICRPDLMKNMLVGGTLFTTLYFIFFMLINLADPNFVSYWNISAVSGILLLGIPLEELFFAFSFGTMWSSIYEHIFGYVLKR
jgi:hypothetical protein